MRENQVKRVITEGGVSLGTFVFEFKTPGIARIVAAAGCQFVIFDMEHTGWSVETIGTLVATSRWPDLAPLVRVPATEYHFLARVLDAGAMGIMVPMVESREQAEQIVQYAKYPPTGLRGAAFGIAHDDYSGGDVAEKMQSANREGLVIAQIETSRGLDNVEEIAAVEGLDILWIGQFDLTTSLGIPGQFTHPDYYGALDRVVEAARRHGRTAGMMATSVDEAGDLLARGFRCLAYSGDIWIYQQALGAAIHSLRPE